VYGAIAGVRADRAAAGLVVGVAQSLIFFLMKLSELLAGQLCCANREREAMRGMLPRAASDLRKRKRALSPRQRHRDDALSGGKCAETTLPGAVPGTVGAAGGTLIVHTHGRGHNVNESDGSPASGMMFAQL